MPEAAAGLALAHPQAAPDATSRDVVGLCSRENEWGLGPRQLDGAASDQEQVRWHWVTGHVGHALNERADLLPVTVTHNAARSVRGDPATGGLGASYQPSRVIALA